MITSEAAGQALEQRVTRAARERGEMTFTKTSGGWAVQTPSGGLYLVTETSCSCGDWKYRCAGRQMLCKHQIALAIRKLERGEF